MTSHHRKCSNRLPALIRAGLALAASIVAGSAALAFPTKPITIVVPFAAGGPSDIIARLFGVEIGKALGGQVIVENVAGAGSTIGIGRVAKADPDGHTLLVSHISHATAASLYKNLPYNSHADFAPIGMMTDGAFVLVGRKDFAAAAIQDVFARIKADGDKIVYAHAGIGSGSHLCGLTIMNALGRKMTEIPYRGTGPAMTDLVSGKVDLLCDQITSALPQIQGGTVKPYAVTAKARVAAIPVPTMAESGIANFEMTIWHGLYAPAGTPADVVNKLNGALRAALKSQLIAQRLADLSTIAATDAQANPDFLGKHLAAEIARWKGIIEAAGVQAQ